MKHYCDTNFVIRYLIGDNKEMLVKTQKVFGQVQTGKVSLILEQTIFTEIVFVLSSFYKAPRNVITEILSELLAYKGIVCEDKESLLQALTIYSKQNLHIVDCILLAKAGANGLDILSFDQKLIDLNRNKGKV